MLYILLQHDSNGVSLVKTSHKGDEGLTDIMGGRLPKDSPPVEFVGEVDELVAILGIARSLLESKEELKEISGEVKAIQVKLMKIAGYVGLGGKGRAEAPVSESELKELENKVGRMWAKLVKTRKFTVPSGPLEVTALNLARTVCRRVERKAVKLLRESVLDELTYKYLNRLSDLIYVYVKLVAKKLGFREEYLE